MTVVSRPLPTQAREYHFPEFSRHTLDNGLKVIVAPVRKLPVVTVLAVIDAGANRDSNGIEGLAQLTAELLREGTEEHDGIEILEGFERLGSSIEAGADWDSTMVSMTLLRHHLTTGLRQFAEVLRTPSFPLHEVERLKAERLAERLQILSEPRGLADEAFSRFLYAPGSRYAEPIGGTSKSISAITRENVIEFFGSFYIPTSATVIVVGDVDASEALGLVRDAFGQWHGVAAPAVDSNTAENRAGRALEIVDKSDAAQAELRLGHIGIPRSHPDYFKVVIMNALLGGLFSSRINLNLRERHGYTYGASSYFDWRRAPGPFLISTAVQSEVSAEAIRETLIEIDGMREKEVPADEFSLATDYLEGVFPIRYETTAAIASALANIVIFNLREDFYDTYRDNIRAVTPRDVLVAAQTHVHPNKLLAVVVADPAIVTRSLESLALGPVTHRLPVDA
ncbi:MAG: M16 family metallopeptidase [Gemmatimonadaceae bacterium]